MTKEELDWVEGGLLGERIVLKLLFRSGAKGSGGRWACGGVDVVAVLELDGLGRSLLVAHGRRSVLRNSIRFMLLVALVVVVSIYETQ